MKKAELLITIEQLNKEILLRDDIISKLIHDYIMIKPVPKGKIEERIIVFTKIGNKIFNEEVSSEQQCEEYPCCADDYCITHKQHMRFCRGETRTI